jgi:hypothetical protein
MNDFQPWVLKFYAHPLNYFWRWTEQNEVIEGYPQLTICYRDEIQHLLHELCPNGLMPFGTLLLLLAACRAKDQATVTDLLLGYIAAHLKDEQELKTLATDAVAFLHIISSLPVNDRVGAGRVLLLKTITGVVAPVQNTVDSKQLAEDLESGLLDENFSKSFKEDVATLTEALFDDLRPLQQALHHFPDKDSLLLKLRTGVTQLPEPIKELELPAVLSPGELLEQLGIDKATSGISLLVKQLMAALQIPMHLDGSSDQSVGGMSGIDNRGNYDHLLLTELANEDEVLMARLANNEALYLRRENMPATQQQHRMILIDATLRMWGTPRIFAHAVAITCYAGKKATSSAAAWLLYGKQSKPVSFDNKTTVMAALGHIDATLYCHIALELLLKEKMPTAATTCFYITGDFVEDDPQALQAFHAIPAATVFIITVNVTGQLKYYKWRAGHRKLLKEVKLDLSVLLPDKSLTKPIRNPADLQPGGFALYYPSSRQVFKYDHFFMVNNILFTVTEDRRLLRWDSHKHGGVEILSFVGEGEVCFGAQGKEVVYLLVVKIGEGLLHQYDLLRQEIKTTESVHPIMDTKWRCFYEGLFYLQISGEKWITLDPLTGKEERFNSLPKNQVKELYDDCSKIIQKFKADRTYLKHRVNNGYTVLTNIRYLGMDSHGILCVDEWRLSTNAKGDLCWTRRDGELLGHRATELNYKTAQKDEPNPHITYQVFIWPDGSKVRVDPRGLITLISANATLPEVSILFILDKITASFSSDGRKTGSPYFIGEEGGHFMEGDNFISRYITPILKTIVHHAVTTKV